MGHATDTPKAGGRLSGGSRGSSGRLATVPASPSGGDDEVAPLVHTTTAATKFNLILSKGFNAISSWVTDLLCGLDGGHAPHSRSKTTPPLALAPP